MIRGDSAAAAAAAAAVELTRDNGLSIIHMSTKQFSFFLLMYSSNTRVVHYAYVTRTIRRRRRRRSLK